MNTMQQEFDAVVAHLYKQGRPARISRDEASMRGTGTCLYRSEDSEGNTLSCAVGCRIPDAIYTGQMEKVGSVHALVRSMPIGLPKEIYTYVELFGNLQSVHDNAIHDDDKFHRGVLEANLKSVAERFDLIFTKPEGF